MDTVRKNKTIMLIDDDIDFLNQNEIQLKQAGFDVVVAESQEDAENILKKFKPDLVISDLMMENYDAGFSIAYHIKKIDPKIPVIIVTGVTHELGFKFFTGTEEERSWIKADAMLNKPIRFEQLMKVINTHLHLDNKE
jgi:DNA-binding response OmpR family regulator